MDEGKIRSWKPMNEKHCSEKQILGLCFTLEVLFLSWKTFQNMRHEIVHEYPWLVSWYEHLMNHKENWVDLNTERVTAQVYDVGTTKVLELTFPEKALGTDENPGWAMNIQRSFRFVQKDYDTYELSNL